MSDGVDPNDAEARLDLARRFITAEHWDRAVWALLDAVYVARKDLDQARVALGDLESVYYTLGKPFEAQMCHV